MESGVETGLGLGLAALTNKGLLVASWGEENLLVTDLYDISQIR